MTRSRLLAALVSVAFVVFPPVSGSAAVGAPPQTSISAHVSKPLLILGQATRVFGEVEPRERGVRVALQRKLSSGWAVLAVQKSNGRGGYGFKVEPTTAGRVAYRTVRLTRTGKIIQRSAKVVVTTYRWHSVNDLDVTESAGVTELDSPATIAGDTYPRSIVLDADEAAEDTDDAGFIEVDTRRCAVFTAVLGALDTNTPGTLVPGRVAGDDEVLSDKSYAVGASEMLLLDVRTYSTLRVDAVTVQQDVSRQLGVGTPMVLCAFEPLAEGVSPD